MSESGASRSLTEWLTWLETLSPTEIVLGLERISTVLDRLHLCLPERVIHVAGTNGKGSSSKMLESLLLLAGHRVGSYTSPHIFDYNERIRINGTNASDDEIVAAFEAVESVRGNLPLTYFEYGTAAALKVFDRRDCDALVLEVGMGGRLDAVNAVEPEAGLITNVALDHCDWLGNDVETIAGEKAGIMREGRCVVFGATDRPQAIDLAAEAVAAKLLCRDRDFAVDCEAASTWSWHGQRNRISGLDRAPFPADWQIDNAAAVLALVEAIGLTPVLDTDSVNRAFGNSALDGRFQRVDTDRRWILDVAHNPHAAEQLAQTLARTSAGPVTAVIGALDDKDQDGLIKALEPAVSNWIAVTANSPRAIPAADLRARISRLSRKPVQATAAISEALAKARAMSQPDSCILVTGSFYVVGPALEWIRYTRAA